MTAKQLEEERSRQRDLKKKVDEAEEEKGVRNQEYEDKIAQVKQDMEELKSRLVAVTRYAVHIYTPSGHRVSMQVSSKICERASLVVSLEPSELFRHNIEVYISSGSTLQLMWNFPF